MATKIQLKRSSGSALPTTIAYGELAHISGVGSFGGADQYKDRLYIGHNDAASPNIVPVGGRYYTSMMDHTPGAIDGVTNSTNLDGGIVAVLDSDRKVDQWNVDNLRIDGNTLSSTDVDGNIILDPNGAGRVVFEGTAIDINKPLFLNAPATFNYGVAINNIGISTDLIRTTSGDTLYIDPYPDGLDNEGTVVIKGNLQVDGTSTIVNSNDLTITEPIITLGLTTTTRTVTERVLSGVSTITIDSVVGLNTGDKVEGSASISAGTTITGINATTEIITISNATTAGIATQTQLLFTVNVDTNTDRGVAFHYNVGEGASDSKKGFFGYIDQTNSGSSAVQRSFTYIPEATITNDVVTGTRGYLDIKGIYYQTGDYNLNGMVYFDVDGLQTSTVSPGSGISTSNFVMTTDSSNVPTWTSTLDGGSY